MSSLNSTWTRDQIGIHLGKKLAIYQKLANFTYISVLTSLKVSCKCLFYRLEPNAKERISWD